MQTSVHENDRVLRISEVIKTTALSRTGIYESVKSKTFPKPLKLSARSIGFLQSEVNAWIKERADAREVNNG